MFKDKKGFTLIELLAVIVILAVIMLIAVPIVIKTIEDAKKGSYQNSAYGIIKAAEFNYSKKIIEGNKLDELSYKYEGGEQTNPQPQDDELDYKGLKPTQGEVKVNDRGQVALAIVFDKYCITKDYEAVKVNINEGIDDCKIKNN